MFFKTDSKMPEQPGNLIEHQPFQYVTVKEAQKAAKDHEETRKRAREEVAETVNREINEGLSAVGKGKGACPNRVVSADWNEEIIPMIMEFWEARGFETSLGDGMSWAGNVEKIVIVEPPKFEEDKVSEALGLVETWLGRPSRTTKDHRR